VDPARGDARGDTACIALLVDHDRRIMIGKLKKIDIITLFVEDLPAAKAFYTGVFGLETIFEDQDSVLLKLDNIMLNLLISAEAPEVVEPRPVAEVESGVRMLLTINVDDVDTVCAELERQGVKIINGPVDRPWKQRTAAFADPSGNMWEISHFLE
jgi:catechol 2,3-dioxygenase-like lactoylglutathione lyase family enzyme